MCSRLASSPDDIQPAVLERARRGDADAFSALVHHYDRGLRALAFRLLGDRDRMDDALQEVYVKAFRALPAFRGGSSGSHLAPPSHVQRLPRRDQTRSPGRVPAARRLATASGRRGRLRRAGRMPRRACDRPSPRSLAKTGLPSSLSMPSASTMSVRARCWTFRRAPSPPGSTALVPLCARRSPTGRRRCREARTPDSRREAWRCPMGARGSRAPFRLLRRARRAARRRAGYEPGRTVPAPGRRGRAAAARRPGGGGRSLGRGHCGRRRCSTTWRRHGS
jgi:hypothetical protein